MHRPSGGFYDTNAGLVAWAVNRIDGSIGVVGCLEAHRKQGLTTKVVAHVLSHITGPVYVSIDSENVASIRLHEKLNFRAVGIKLFWFRLETV